MGTSKQPVRVDGASKAWSGRFSESPDARLEAFNASVTFDIRLVRDDIRGSIAHVRMLGRQGIVSLAEAEEIEAGLWRILDEIDAGEFSLSIADEDVHTGVERRLRELIGPVTGKLHTGRSRNDQVVNDVRMWTKRAILAIFGGVLDLSAALTDVAEAHLGVVMPGYTHLQRAQPVLLAHHLHAYVAMLERDTDRLQDAFRRTDVLALGSAALAGSAYPIDREFVAADLGFEAISTNSMDAVSDRDFVLDVLYACSLIALHVSRLSDEIIFWSSGEVGFLELSDAFSTGSSIMPQKKNPDIAELARGKTGRVFGHLVGMLTVIKGLPLTFNKDFQEDKEGLFDSVDTILAVLAVFPPMLRTATFKREKMAEAALGNFSLATDVADTLAKLGVPFREAHEVVGRLVRSCTERDKSFADVTDEEWAEAHPIFAEVHPHLTALESVAARDVPGGTAPVRVAAALSAAKRRLAVQRAWVGEREAAMSALFAHHGDRGSP
ncbi:MAG: argininosuccinate lyase [Thermomicrobiales bacterium]